MAGQYYDGQGRVVGLKLFQDGEAVHVAQHQVEQDGVQGGGFGHAQALGAVGGLLNGVFPCAQHGLEGLAGVGVVFYHEEV